MKINLDDKFILIIPLFFILILLLGLVCYDSSSTRKANEKLKKEVYEYKQKLNKCQDERLKEIIKGE